MGADVREEPALSRAPEKDERLVEAARLGDQGAFTTLLRRHDDQMRALAWSVLRDRTAMDDVLQDAYLKAFRNLDRFRGESRFSTWLHRIVYRTCLDHVRRRWDLVLLSDDAEPPAPGRPHGDVDERLALEQALTAYTRAGAYAAFLEDRIGTLAPGKLADLVVLAQNLFEVPATEIAQTEVRLTMVGGRIVWREGI